MLYVASNLYRSILLKALHIHHYLISFISTHVHTGLCLASLTSVIRYISMRKALDISRLTRPARIRCRPSLFLRNRSLSSSASQSKPSDAPVKISDGKEEGVGKPLIPAFGARRAEMEDYILAMEMAKLEDGYGQPRGMSRRSQRSSSNTHMLSSQLGRFANPNCPPYMIRSLFYAIRRKPRHPRLPHPHHPHHNQAERVKRKK